MREIARRHVPIGFAGAHGYAPPTGTVGGICTPTPAAWLPLPGMSSARTAPGPGHTMAVRAALVFALLWPTLATWMYFVWLAGRPAAPVVYAIGKIVQFAWPCLVVFGLQRRAIRLAPPRSRGLGIGIVFGLAVAALILALHRFATPLVPVLAPMGELVRAKLASFHIETRAAFALLALFYSVLHSLLEEYYWRWFVFGELRARMPVAAAIALSSAAFTAHHVILLSQFLGGFR